MSAQANGDHSAAESTPQPMVFGAEGNLFGVFHPAPAPVRAAAVMCPPLLHEHVRSYRFFAQIAAALAKSGVACLRFDYRGTGDSGGAENEFTLASAVDDIDAATRELQRLAGDAPVVLMAVRGAALLATIAVQRHAAARLWLWQPVWNGARYLDELIARDHSERNSRLRFPLRTTPAPRSAHELLGFPLGTRVWDELRVASTVLPALLPTTVVDVEPPPEKRRGVDWIQLPETVASWASEIDLSRPLQPGDAREAIAQLLAGLDETKNE